MDYYFKGHRIVINNFKKAAGVFDADKYISIIQAVVNLSISIIMVKLIGLPGIFVGTVIQGLVSTFTRPFIVYKKILFRSAKEYYFDSFIFLGVLLIPIFFLESMRIKLMVDVTILNLIIMVFCVFIVSNLTFFIFFKKRKEFQYILKILQNKIKKK